MINLGEKNVAQPRVRIGEWVRTNERFIDGYELLPFTDYQTGAEIPTRTLPIYDFPDLWKFGYGWNDVKKTIDFSAQSNFSYPSPSYVRMLNLFYFRNGDSLYTADPFGELSEMPTRLVNSNYTFKMMPKAANDHSGIMVIGVTDGSNNDKLMRSADNGAVWEDYLTFPAVLQDFDCSVGSNRIAAISSIQAGEAYTQAVFEVVKDAESGEFVINTLPTVGLDTTQQMAEVYLLIDNNYNYPKDYNIRHIVVRYQQTEAGKPMFAIYRRADGKWDNFQVPYQYATWTNGTEIFSGYGTKYLYFGFEKGIWKINPDTLEMSEIKVVSRYRRPVAADGSTEYPSENLSYNGTIVKCAHYLYPDVDNTSVNVKSMYLFICGGNSLYVLDCKDDSVHLVRDKTKIGAEIRFVVGDTGMQYAWRNDGKVEQFNMIPNLYFKVDAFKVNGVIDTSYRLVARKVPF